VAAKAAAAAAVQRLASAIESLFMREVFAGPDTGGVGHADNGL
jgi:hypothetical protein